MDPAHVVDLINHVGDQVPGWVAALTTLIVALKAITTVTPTQHDNLILGAILRVINIIALNVGKAKNADDVPRSDGAAEDSKGA